MPEYLAPGVYIEEVEMGGKPIEGVSTSTAGFIGETDRGPTMPRLITGLEQFLRLYGGFLPDSYLPYAVEGFFSNGGKRCFVCRIVGKNSSPATLEIPAHGDKSMVSSSREEPVKEKPKKPSKPAAGESLDEIKPVVESPQGNPGENPGKAFSIKTIGPGVWGNRVAIKIGQASLSALNPKLFKLVVIYWKAAPPEPVVDPTDPDKQRDSNRREPSLIEVYDNLSPETSSSDYYEKRINNISSLIEINKISDAVSPATGGLIFLKGGSDGAQADLSDYKGKSGANPGERTGLSAFTEVDEISIVCIPNENNFKGLTDEIVKHCELMKDRFAVLQAKQSAGLVSELMPPTDSKYAAFYYPWIKVMDPLTNSSKLIPPGGHIVGVYARSDTERGVHKAPANEIVRGAVGLQFLLTKGEQDILNPRGVNCIKAFRGRGIRVWGARTISSDPIWKYVNVRRLFLYIEESIEEGTQWVVFEPNDQRLWARVKQTVADFLTRVWKDGALMGTTPDEAFFVKCDETTMTPDDIDNGRLIILIGIAPVKPAEFVIFRIAQWRSGSEITE
jgi:phage tail sheath protein FI